MDEDALDRQEGEYAITKEFALEKVFQSDVKQEEAEQEILRKLEEFSAAYEHMLNVIHDIGRKIERSSQYTQDEIRGAVFLHYRKKLNSLRRSIIAINERIRQLQGRLNTLRKQLYSKTSLVQKGPFYYKCTYLGGVRYRDQPSSSAHIVKNNLLVQYNEVVEIAERVFIGREESVYLHHRGVGWLFENSKDLVCFERVPAVSLQS